MAGSVPAPAEKNEPPALTPELLRRLHRARHDQTELTALVSDLRFYVVVACGKCNDAPDFKTFGLAFRDGVYVHDPSFDVDAWVADVEGKRTETKCSIQDIVDFLSEQPDGSASQRAIAAHAGVNESTVGRKVKAGVEGHFLRTRKVGKEIRVFSTGKIPPRAPLDSDASDERTTNND